MEGMEIRPRIIAFLMIALAAMAIVAIIVGVVFSPRKGQILDAMTPIGRFELNIAALVIP